MTRSVVAPLYFFIKSDQEPRYVASQVGAGAKLNLQGEFAYERVEINNARDSDNLPMGRDFELDKEGFCLVNHHTQVTDFHDSKQIKDVYELEVERLISARTGAYRVTVFDHTLRADDSQLRAEKGSREATQLVHNDYTNNSAVKRLKDHFTEAEADSLLKTRFAIINIWRPICYPVETAPLAVCEAKSIEFDDLVPCVRESKQRTGELMLVCYNPGQRWYYFPDMELDEALLIKTFDSARDDRARLSVHSAFKSPDTPIGARPRQSLETRVFAFFH